MVPSFSLKPDLPSCNYFTLILVLGNSNISKIKMSLTVSDVIHHLTKSGKKETANFLIEHDRHLPFLASEKSYAKSCDSIQTKLKTLKTSISTAYGRSKLSEIQSETYYFPIPRQTKHTIQTGVESSENIVELQSNVETFKHVSFSLAKELHEA